MISFTPTHSGDSMVTHPPSTDARNVIQYLFLNPFPFIPGVSGILLWSWDVEMKTNGARVASEWVAERGNNQEATLKGRHG